MASKFQSLLCLSIWLLAGSAYGGNIAAWYNTRGPSILMQDDDTGGIRYSYCNGNSTPILPEDTSMVLPLTQYTPRNNTGLSATGWYDGNTTWTSMFYLSDDGSIVNSLLECDWNTGEWVNTGDWVISGGAPTPAINSSITAVLLGSTAGYRVFYNGLDGTLHEIGYTKQWSYYGVVSNDAISSPAIGATFFAENENVTVVRPRDSKNIGVSTWYPKERWNLTSFPEPLAGDNNTNGTSASNLELDSSTTSYDLPSWDGTASTIVAGIDNSLTHYVFYIGTDKQLHQAFNGKEGWLLSTEADKNSWPVADTAGGSLGISCDYTTQAIRLYYSSGGSIVEVASNDGKWATATTLATSNATSTGNSTGDSGSDSDNNDNGGGGLSDGAKAGISAGVTLGVIAIAGMIIAFVFLRRRQRKLDADAAAPEVLADGSSPHSQQPLQPQQQAYASPGSAHTYPTTAYSAGGAEGGYYHDQQGMYPGNNQAVDANGYPVAQPGYVQNADGSWAYVGAGANGVVPQQQQQQQEKQAYPHELPEQRPPVEMMGEGHYKEAPGDYVVQEKK
ncbi:hypothetical protein F5Y15DRAFT_284132 [Xylariaceae sp. FL0016]|nr:hypothetical protein F5Y15DRAFT_284132 [Xylariaceae sp. FL0016]